MLPDVWKKEIEETIDKSSTRAEDAEKRRKEEKVYEALRKIAYDERVKIHDVVIDGIDAAFTHPQSAGKNS